MARHLGEPVLLVDPNRRLRRRSAAALADAARQLGCDLVVLVDVGGDVLAHGDEAGPGQPAGRRRLPRRRAALAEPASRVLGAIFGAGCDGELTPGEVLERDRRGRRRRRAPRRVGPRLAPSCDRLEAAVAEIPTEASAMALRCARGELGSVADPRRAPDRRS